MAKILIKRSNLSGFVPTTNDLSTGELQLNTFDGKLYMKRDKLTGTEIIEIGKDAQTAVKLANARKINGVLFDGTADISFGTTNVAEGTNLYYTQARFDNAFAAKSTTDLVEGSNLYYTTARASAAAPVQKVAGRTGNVTLSVSDVSGAVAKAGDTMTGFLTLSSNPTAAYHAATKYYVDLQIINGTAAAANKLANARTINGTSFDGTADISFTTDSVLEGTTNLYFTTARARASISASGQLSYNSTTGALTYTVPASGYGSGDFKANGTVTMTGTFKGLDAQLTGSLTYGSVYQSGTKVTAIRQTTPYTVMAFPVTHKAVKLIIKVLETGTGNLHVVEMLVMNDGTTVSFSQYGLLTTNDELCTFDFSISAGGVSLIMTPASSLDKEITVALTSLL